MLIGSDQASCWEAFGKEINEFEEKNRSDDTGITLPASNIVDTAKIDACDVPEPMVSSAAEVILIWFFMLTVTFKIFHFGR